METSKVPGDQKLLERVCYMPKLKVTKFQFPTPSPTPTVSECIKKPAGGNFPPPPPPTKIRLSQFCYWYPPFSGICILLTHSSENGRFGRSPKPLIAKSGRFERLFRDLRFVS